MCDKEATSAILLTDERFSTFLSLVEAINNLKKK